MTTDRASINSQGSSPVEARQTGEAGSINGSVAESFPLKVNYKGVENLSTLSFAPWPHRVLITLPLNTFVHRKIKLLLYIRRISKNTPNILSEHFN